MKTPDFGTADLNRVASWPGMTRLFSGRCAHCGKTYRAPPCDQSDHYRTMINLAIEEHEKDWVSFACSHPLEQQAPILAARQDRRHPYTGDRPRPQWSGYCTTEACDCDCHNDKPDDQPIDWP